VDFYAQNQFNAPYIFSHQLMKSNDNQIASFELSCIGEYDLALKEWDRSESKQLDLTPKEIADFSKYKAKNPIQYISDKAKNEQIIIVNEAHYQPYHRVFTTLLLKNLYEAGFRFLCIETLSYEDTALNNRKYPLIYTGGYSKEPCFGNLIREALNIGFKLVPYEDTKNLGFDSLGNNLREIEEARNIKSILDKDPKAKILIYCGFGHLKETPLKQWGKAMAGRLIEYTAINPLTIDQVTMTEHYNPEVEDPYFKYSKAESYAVFVDSNGKAFNGAEENKQYDLRVYHPRTKYIHGRPHWIFENKRKPYFVSNIEVKLPCQIFAYIASEPLNELSPYENPIPFDIIEISDLKSPKALSLKKGNYKILIINEKGERQNLTAIMD